MNASFSDIDPTTMVAVSIFIGILLFLILRELFCWYWKINTRIYLLEKSLQAQNKTVELLNDLIIETRISRDEMTKINFQK